MAGDRYTILYMGTRAICPVCSGMITGQELIKKCIDCKRIFICTGKGIADTELQYKEVDYGEKQQASESDECTCKEAQG